MRTLKHAFLLFTLATLAPAGQAAELSGSVRIDGSSTVFPITEAVAEEFQQQNRQVKLTVGVSGTGGGFKKLTAGETDINNASRPISADEVAKAKANGIEVIELPIAYDGLTVVVHPKNSFVKSLSLEQLKKLWEPGSTVKTWKDLDPRWPAETIKLYGPGADSGTFDYFTETVVGKAKASRTDYTASEDDNALVKGVSGDVNALGYFGYGYFVENKSRVAAVAIDGGKGAVAPSDATIGSASYPLSRFLYLCVSKQATTRPELDAFVRFYLKNAKTLAHAVGYTPLAEALYAEALSRYDAKKTGNWASH
jgi:phosphate transport system substrate-binding protein